MSGEDSDRSMRLLVLAEDFYPNVSGGAHARWRFCQLAAERGHDITVFTPKREGAPKRETVDGVDIRRPFPAKPSGTPAYATLALITRTLYSVALFWYLLVWLRGREFDGVHSASHSMHWVGKVLGTVYRLPFVSFIGYTPSANGSFRWRPAFLRERINFRFFMGGIVFCRSERVATVLRESCDSDVRILHGVLNLPRIREAYGRCDPPSIRNRFDLKSDDHLLIFVGRLVPVKNPIGAIEVLQQLPEKYHLAMIGTGPLEDEVRDVVERLGLPNRVHFTGRLAHEETLRCMAAAEILLLPSEEEAYPTAVFEALALGKDVVARRVGVLPEIDHERLHLGEISEFSSHIESNLGATVSTLDEETASTYSMERYSQEILDAFRCLNECK